MNLAGDDMKVLYRYSEGFAWTQAMKTLDQVPESLAQEHQDVVVAFVHVEPKDTHENSSARTEFIKNAKWPTRKWEVKKKSCFIRLPTWLNKRPR